MKKLNFDVQLCLKTSRLLKPASTLLGKPDNTNSGYVREPRNHIKLEVVMHKCARVHIKTQLRDAALAKKVSVSAPRL